MLIAGAAAALVAGVGVAALLVSGGRREAAPPPASQGGLVIEAGADDQNRIDPAKPLRCFVQGQLVGELTLADCARRNGVATDALDVGVDPQGALAASPEAGMALTPLPPQEAAPASDELQPAEPGAEAPAPLESQAACWRYARPQWRKLPTDLGLDACVQALFSGRCEKSGSVAYGRWGMQTLRLVGSRVDTSSDNQTFHPLTTLGTSCPASPPG